MCTTTTASDAREHYQDQPSISHSDLSFTTIPASNSLSCHSSIHQQPVDYFPPQPDMNEPLLIPNANMDGYWQSFPPRAPRIQAADTGHEPYTSFCNGGASLPEVPACAPLPSSSMQQFYTSPTPLHRPVPVQTPGAPSVPPYQPDNTLEGIPDIGRLFFPNDSPGDFDSITGLSTDDQLDQFSISEPSSIPSDQWLPLPASYPLTTGPSDCIPSTPFSLSPSMSTVTAPASFNPPPQRSLSTRSSQSTDLTNFGIPSPDGTWRCAYPGCSSQAVFRRGCDLRKHYNRHRKHLFCRHEGCPQASHGGFSSKKDRARHEARHNPGVPCEWSGCYRVFSRVDNMKDHVRRIHKRGKVGR